MLYKNLCSLHETLVNCLLYLIAGGTLLVYSLWVIIRYIIQASSKRAKKRKSKLPPWKSIHQQVEFTDPVESFDEQEVEGENKERA